MYVYHHHMTRNVTILFGLRSIYVYKNGMFRPHLLNWFSVEIYDNSVKVSFHYIHPEYVCG